MIFADVGMVYVVLEYGRHDDEGWVRNNAWWALIRMDSSRMNQTRKLANQRRPVSV